MNTMTGLPTIHLNGTGAKTLAAGYESAYDALHALKNAMAAIEFNSRDYYVDGPQSWEIAVNSRIAINQKIAEIQTYLTKHLQHIHEQTR